MTGINVRIEEIDTGNNMLLASLSERNIAIFFKR